MRHIPHVSHLAQIDEYVYAPQIDTARPNAYAMIIGLRPGAAMRAIGEVDYENARIAAGRGLTPVDAESPVAVVGRLYARQRLGIETASDHALTGEQTTLNGRPFAVVGIYTTENDFGDNQIKKGNDHLSPPGLKGNDVEIAYVNDKGARIAKSIEVKSAKP